MQKGLQKKYAGLGDICASEPVLVHELIVITLPKRKGGENAPTLEGDQ